MKKIILPIFVALMATVLFTSCEKDMTDDELRTELQNQVFTGSNDSGSFTLNLASATFELDEPDTVEEDGTVWENISTGTWIVTNGELILSIVAVDGDVFLATAKLAIEKSGKRLQLPTWNGAAYNGPTVQLDRK